MYGCTDNEKLQVIIPICGKMASKWGRVPVVLAHRIQGFALARMWLKCYKTKIFLVIYNFKFTIHFSSTSTLCDSTCD